MPHIESSRVPGSIPIFVDYFTMFIACITRFMVVKSPFCLVNSPFCMISMVARSYPPVIKHGLLKNTLLIRDFPSHKPPFRSCISQLATLMTPQGTSRCFKPLFQASAWSSLALCMRPVTASSPFPCAGFRRICHMI